MDAPNVFGLPFLDFVRREWSCYREKLTQRDVFPMELLASSDVISMLYHLIVDRECYDNNNHHHHHHQQEAPSLDERMFVYMALLYMYESKKGFGSTVEQLTSEHEGDRMIFVSHATMHLFEPGNSFYTTRMTVLSTHTAFLLQCIVHYADIHFVGIRKLRDGKSQEKMDAWLDAYQRLGSVTDRTYNCDVITSLSKHWRGDEDREDMFHAMLREQRFFVQMLEKLTVRWMALVLPCYREKKKEEENINGESDDEFEEQDFFFCYDYLTPQQQEDHSREKWRRITVRRSLRSMLQMPQLTDQAPQEAVYICEAKHSQLTKWCEQEAFDSWTPRDVQPSLPQAYRWLFTRKDVHPEQYESLKPVTWGDCIDVMYYYCKFKVKVKHGSHEAAQFASISTLFRPCFPAACSIEHSV